MTFGAIVRDQLCTNKKSSALKKGGETEGQLLCHAPCT